MRVKSLLVALLSALSLGIAAQPESSPYEYDLSYFMPKGEYTYDPSIPTPESVLGFQLGRQHADWGQVVDYMKHLDAVSDRVSVRETGRTYQYRPFIEVTISSASNQSKMERIKSEHMTISDTEKSSSLNLDDMPVVVSLVYSIHGNEPSGVNSSLAVAYFLAAANGNGIEELLDKTVILMTPGANPDGINRFASWVNTTRSNTDVSDLNSREFKEPWPSSRTNHYWADCNRDWLMLQHPEGRNSVSNYLDWMPNVLADLHEQGASRPYYFSPGHPKRVHHLIKDDNQRFASRVSEVVAEELDKIGTLYYSKEGYDDYYIGKGAAYGDIHGSICLLYEQGTSRGHLRETVNGTRSFAWTIRNQAYGSYGTILSAYRMRGELLAYQRDFFKSSMRNLASQPVKGYIFDANGSKSVAYHFLRNLKGHDIDVYRLAKDATVEGDKFSCDESYIIPLDQKFGEMVTTIMEDVHHYDDSIFYDISSWSFPRAFNLRSQPVKSLSGLVGDRVADIAFPKGEVKGGKSDYGYIFSTVEFYAPKIMHELMLKGLHVYVGDRPFHFKSGDVEMDMGYGTVMVPVANQPISADELYRDLSALASQAGVDIYSATTGLMEDVDFGSPAFHPLTLPKVAIIVGSTMGVPDSGEAWFLLDRRFQMRPTLIEASTSLNAEKLSKYTVIIMANGMPGLSASSSKALREWVASGGTLILSGKACKWADKNGLLAIKEKDASFKEDSTIYRPFAEKREASAGNSIDGVMLNCHLDISHPLAWGFNQQDIAVIKNNNIIFEKDPDPYASPLRYTPRPRLSGFLSAKNEELLADSPAVIARGYKSGSVIAFADDMNFRSYFFGTSKIFMNAIFFAKCF